jgi:hypothetical protein
MFCLLEPLTMRLTTSLLTLRALRPLLCAAFGLATLGLGTTTLTGCGDDAKPDAQAAKSQPTPGADEDDDGVKAPPVVEVDPAKLTEAGERVMPYDLNRDGKADVWKFSVGSAEGERAVRKEIDMNFDGKVDVWRYYDETGKQVNKELWDLDFDGRVDVTAIINNGIVVRKELDLNFDKKPDLWKHYSKGQIIRIEQDRDFNGKIDYWERWVGGQVDRIGYDDNGDGELDRWERQRSEG